MARDAIRIPLSTGPIYEAVGLFFATLAYPEDTEKRQRFADVMSRELIRILAERDSAFSSTRQPIWARYLALTKSQISTEMKTGTSELKKRKIAVVATGPLFEEAFSDQDIEYIKASGLRNTAVNRAVMAAYWLGTKDYSDKNMLERNIKPSIRVLHAAYAYWETVYNIKTHLKLENEQDAERFFVHDVEVFSTVILRAEFIRQKVVPKIKAHGIASGNQIEFRIV